MFCTTAELLKWTIWLTGGALITLELDHDRLGGEREVGREPVEDEEEDGEEEENEEPYRGGVTDEGLGDQNVEHPLNTPLLKW